MKFSSIIFGSLSVLAQSRRFSASNGCQSLCDGLEDCRNDPHAHGSYCKDDHHPDTCFGLYWANDAETEMCYQPNSSVPCPENRPVRCPRVVDECQDICNGTPGCVSDKHGSYCKDWQTVPVCFGLYYADSTKTSTCFQPSANGACPETLPVLCGSQTAPSQAATSDAPTGAPATPVTTMRSHHPSHTVAPSETGTTALRTRQPRPTVAVTPAPVPTAAPAAGPSGTYVGTVTPLTMTVTITAPNVMTIQLVIGGTMNFSGSNIGYRVNGDRIELVNDSNLTSFLAQLPMPVQPTDITITYNAVTDVQTGRFLVFTIVGTKAA